MRLFQTFHEAAPNVRFWVPLNGTFVSAMVSDTTLRTCFLPPEPRATALTIFGSHLKELDEMVRRKFADGALEPVVLSDSDFHIDAVMFRGSVVSRLRA